MAVVILASVKCIVLVIRGFHCKGLNLFPLSKNGCSGG